MKKLYTASVHVKGGREGRATSSDSRFEVELTPPKELGGSGTGANPEQFFAAGYGACFESAVRHVARSRKIAITESSVDSTVDLLPRPEGGFALAVELKVSLPGIDRHIANELLEEADQVCPYSHATRGNIEVSISLA